MSLLIHKINFALVAGLQTGLLHFFTVWWMLRSWPHTLNRYSGFMKLDLIKEKLSTDSSRIMKSTASTDLVNSDYNLRPFILDGISQSKFTHS